MVHLWHRSENPVWNLYICKLTFTLTPINSEKKLLYNLFADLIVLSNTMKFIHLAYFGGFALIYRTVKCRLESERQGK